MRWIWVGGVTDTTAEFRVRTKKGTEVVLYVGDGANPELSFEPVLGDPNANAYTFRYSGECSRMVYNVLKSIHGHSFTDVIPRVTGLKPSTTYKYSVSVDGLRSAPAAFRRLFKTFPTPGTPTSFTFAFSSGARTGK